MSTPLFLLSAPRTGSTFVASVLNAHPKILLTDETGLFMLMDDIIRKSYNGIDSGVLFSKKHAAVIGSYFKGKYRNLIEELYSDIMISEQKSNLMYWGEKHPHLVLCLDRISDDFADAKFIHLVRNPVSTIKSIMAMRSTDAQDATDTWRDFIVPIEQFLSNCDKTRFFELSYEVVISRLETEIRRTLNWLGLDLCLEVSDFIAQRSQIDAHDWNRTWTVKDTEFDPGTLSTLRKDQIDLLVRYCHRYGYPVPGAANEPQQPSHSG